MVLTGSGNNTQLVQFLAESELAGDKSIVCTRPPYKEESRKYNSVIRCASSYHHPDSKVIYTNDNNISWASCIVFDEAHLNTDLLLVMLMKGQRLIIKPQLNKYIFGCATYHVQLHPLLMCYERPSWVEIIAVLNRYVACATSIPPAPSNISQTECRKLQLKVLTGLGTTLLKRFRGESSFSLKHFVSHIRDAVKDDRICVEVSVDHNKISLFAPCEHMREVSEIVNSALELEGKWIQNECLEKCLFSSKHVQPPVALLGSGGEIKYLELENRCLTVDIFVQGPGPYNVDEKELLSFLEKHTSGNICAVHKLSEGNEKWGRVTFGTPEAAEKATKLTRVDLKLKIAPAASKRCIFGGDKDNKFSSFPAVKAEVSWPRSLPCDGVYLGEPSLMVLEEALLREVVSSFMPAGISKNEGLSVHIFPCKPTDSSMRAEISFGESLHLEAAKALNRIDGKAVLPGCWKWQKIKWQQQFNTSVSCPAFAYEVIKDQLHTLLRTLQLPKGAELFSGWNEDRTRYRVTITAESAKILVKSGRPLEQLMNGRTIIDDRLTPPVIQLIFSPEGFSLQESIQRETATYFLFDTHNRNSFTIFGPLDKLDLAHHKLVQSFVTLHENKQLDDHVHRRGPTFQGSDFTLNTRHHIISTRLTKELKQNIEETLIHENIVSQTPPSCSICLCDIENGYRLENCNHEFCRSCLVQQCEHAIKNPGNNFPIRCAHEGCGALILVMDLTSLLETEKQLDELFRASIGLFVASSGGKYRFCPSPDCPSVYKVTEDMRSFTCGACSAKTCTQCHLEYHRFVSCEMYKEFKRDPYLSLKEWIKGKEESVKQCPGCMFTIEKIDRCNHVECRCGIHICWVCLEHFKTLSKIFSHMMSHSTY